QSGCARRLLEIEVCNEGLIGRRDDERVCLRPRIGPVVEQVVLTAELLVRCADGMRESEQRVEDERCRLDDAVDGELKARGLRGEREVYLLRINDHRALRQQPFRIDDGADDAIT